jgi:succinate dehydrogenase / fumarate reductase iron-sulfur subunit
MAEKMTIHLRIWRQAGPDEKGAFKDYTVDDANSEMSFLELLDVLNEHLVTAGDVPIEFDNDCREGICGSCGLVINGVAHGPERATTTCQLHMRSFRDGDELWVEPWRARAFGVLKDLVVDRGALDRIIRAGGYVSVGTGAAPEAAAIPIPKDEADDAMDAAACIGCGACVAACPNASAMLFTGAKITHLGLLPQGQAERHDRVLNMVAAMEAEGFGSCSNVGECREVCPKEIDLGAIGFMNADLFRAIGHRRRGR